MAAIAYGFLPGAAIAASTCGRSVPTTSTSSFTATRVFSQLRLSVADSSRMSPMPIDRKSTRLNSSHLGISYAVFCLKKKKLLKIAPPYKTLVHLFQHHFDVLTPDRAKNQTDNQI